jgi:hypothetical protein
MRKFLLLPAILFCSSLIIAQKVDLDKFKFKTAYLRLPNNPLPEEYTTFSTKFIANGINLNDAGWSGGESSLEAAYFTINGFKRVANGGHFTIKVQIDGYDFGKPTTEKKEEKTKSKEGVETITTTYRVVFKYFVPMMYTITDLDGKVLQDGALTDGGREKTYESSYYSTTAALEKYWNENAASTKRGLLGGYISEKLSAFQARLNREFGYNPVAESDVLWITDSPKHPENKAYQKACADAKAALEEMTTTKPVSLVKMKPIIAYFDSLLMKYPKDEKSDKKLRFGAWYNMSTIYYWLEDYNNAIRCGEGLIANDYDKSDGKALKEMSTKMKTRMATSPIKTIHYTRDVTNAMAPSMTETQKEEDQMRQNALKEKAMREQAEREVAASQRQSSSNSNILDLDKSIKAIGNLLGKKKEPITFDRPLLDMIISMNESLANFQLLQKSISINGCSATGTADMRVQFDSFKKHFEVQKEKGTLGKSTLTKLKTLVDSYDKMLDKEILVAYVANINSQKIQEVMTKGITNLKEQNTKILDNLTNDNADKNVLLVLIADVQKNLNYGAHPLLSQADCSQQAYETALESYKKLKTWGDKTTLAIQLRLPLKSLLLKYEPLFREEKCKIKEAENVKLIQETNNKLYRDVIYTILIK